MTPSIWDLFLFQSASALVLWVLVFRRLTVPFGGKLLAVTAYLTVPAFIAIKGTQSAVYVSDFAMPVLCYALVARGAVQRLMSDSCFLSMAAFLVLLPLFFGVMYMSLDGKAPGFGSRDVKGDIIWVYRNVTLLALFAYGLSMQLSRGQFVDFVKLTLVLALVLAIAGALNYFGSFNLAFFDELNNPLAFRDDYNTSRIGAGFMGLFRGSVGQWFATVVVMAVGVYGSLSGGYRKVALFVIVAGVGMILLSYSRAGLVGVCLGFLVLAIFGSGVMQRLTAVAGVVVVAGWLIWQSAALLKRVSTIYTGETEAGGRISSWIRTLNYFIHSREGLLMGVGPTNRQAVADIAGTYGAHNEYLDVIYRFGITGLVVLVIVIVLLMRRVWKHRGTVDEQTLPLVNMVIAVLLVNYAIGLSQNNLMQDYSNYTVAFFTYLVYGMALGVKWEESPVGEPREAPVERPKYMQCPRGRDIAVGARQIREVSGHGRQ